MWVRFLPVPRPGSTVVVRWIANPEGKGSIPFPALYGVDPERLMGRSVNPRLRSQVGSTPTHSIRNGGLLCLDPKPPAFEWSNRHTGVLTHGIRTAAISPDSSMVECLIVNRLMQVRFLLRATTVTELASCTRFRLEVMWVRVPPVVALQEC